MNRRDFIKFAGSFSVAAGLLEKEADAQTPDVPPAQGVAAPPAELPGNSTPGDAAPDPEQFTYETLIGRAETLARQPFVQPELKLPQELAELDQQRYRAIEFKPEAAVWKDEPVNFALQFFHTGFQYKIPVAVNLIEGGIARPYLYSSLLFNFNAPLSAPPADSQSGFSGLRVHALTGANPSKEPYLTFQGASYFKSIGAGQAFGLSARGLALNTAQASGEEYPFFRELWIEKPDSGQRLITVYALLDGPSLAGAYRFRTEPGYSTVMDVECTLFPRKPLTHLGIGALSSMYFFGAADPTRPDDYRPNVHSSDGMQIWNGSGEWIWRPLINPQRLQYSVFIDKTPKGFGLFQRKRAFGDFEDIEARFGERPSLWVEPVGDWGEGAVDLIELPTRSEIYDNIIAFWRPKSPLLEQTRHDFRYRLHWGWDAPLRSTKLYVSQTRIGSLGESGPRFFVIDFVSGGSCANCNLNTLAADVKVGDGEIINIAVRQNPATGGQRVTFEFRPGGAPQTDIRCTLKQNGQGISETWIYRWTA